MDSIDFSRLRPRLHGIAYRMLGSRAEAEEVVQDAWLRWHEGAPEGLDSTEAWLVTVTTRLAIDRLRAAKAQREQYVGFWLPEPLVEESPVTPEQLLEGVHATLRQLSSALERNKVVELNPAAGTKFDPHQHQAISVVPAASQEPNTVVTVLQKGYSISERVLRPALVTVSAPN